MRVQVPIVLFLGGLAVAGCSEKLTGPTPEIDSLTPSLVCGEQLVTEVHISGASLSPLGIDEATGDPHLAIPDITLRRIRDAAGAEVDDAPITLPNDPLAPDAAHLRWTSTSAMAFDVYPELALESGAYEVTVTNRNGNSATLEAAIAVVPKPSILSVDPSLICLEQGMRELIVTGEGFIVMNPGGTPIYPTITLGELALTVTGADGCLDIAGTSLSAQSCTHLTVSAPASDALIGSHLLSMTNPEPASCSSEGDTVDVYVAPAPAITAVEPMSICSGDQPAQMTVVGSGFLRADIGGTRVDPAVLVDGVAFDGTFSDCTAISDGSFTGEACTLFVFDVPLAGFATGTHTIEITNPPAADCAATGEFAVSDPPEIESVTPFKVCAGGDSFDVNGTGFATGQEIHLDQSIPVSTAINDPTSATGTFGDGDLSPGTYDVSVSAGGLCESNVLVDALQVVSAPVLFFADPPTVYDGIDMRLTFWISGISGAAPQVGIRATGTADPLTMLSDPTYNGTNRIFATLTGGLVAPGTYDVVILDDPCDTELVAALHVTDTLGVYVSSMSPTFGSEGERTAVTLRSDLLTTPIGFDNFAQTPRVYLNPVGGGTATELRSVQWLGDPSRITGVVPETLAPGDYQVLVINPNGGVGILAGTVFTVLDVADPPVVIDNLDPGQIVAATAQPLSIIGKHFPTALADLDVSARCRDPRAADPASTEVEIYPTAIAPVSALQIDTTWDASGFAGFVCVVKVSHLINGSFAEFSAFSVTNSAGNIAPFFDSGRAMNENRRALASAAMQLNAQSRYLFAIGGDGGDDAINPVVRHSSVEAAQVDPFGEIVTAFAIQRNALPETRAFAAASVIGRYLYLAGGRVGDAPGTVSDEVLRAYLLDPFEAPVISDLSLALGTGSGLGGGLWYYRISAVMDDGSVLSVDPNNPGGEGLASDPFNVQLPDLPSKLLLSLYWNHVPGAVKYRIYRTTTIDQVAGTEVLVAEMNALSDAGTLIDNGGSALAVQSFTDDGIDNAAATETPLPIGSLGVWHSVATLNRPREGAAVITVPDSVDGNRNYLYVIGGRSDSGAVLDTYERTLITAAGSNSQTVDAGGMVLGTALLPTDGAPTRGPRWQLGAVYFDASKSAIITGDDVYVFALPGIDGAGNNVDRVTSFLVDVADGNADAEGADGDGSLSNATNQSAPNPKFAGYGYVGDHDYIHLLGSQTGGPSTGGMECFLLPTVPQLNNWNAGTSLVEPRYLHASASESAFVYLLGGQTSVQASNTVEQTNF